MKKIAKLISLDMFMLALTDDLGVSDMRRVSELCSRVILSSVCFISFSNLIGCATTEQSIALGVAGVTFVGGSIPSSEIEQVYYLGIYDERSQLPPEFYRIKVHGQASALSDMTFGSGWVPAKLVDTLNPDSQAMLSKSDIDSATGQSPCGTDFLTGRKLILYGPEGFRRVPNCYRLALVMGADPSAFFSAMDQTLGYIHTVKSEERDNILTIQLLKHQSQLHSESSRLEDLEDSL